MKYVARKKERERRRRRRWWWKREEEEDGEAIRTTTSTNVNTQSQFAFILFYFILFYFVFFFFFCSSIACFFCFWFVFEFVSLNEKNIFWFFFKPFPLSINSIHPYTFISVSLYWMYPHQSIISFHTQWQVLLQWFSSMRVEHKQQFNPKWRNIKRKKHIEVEELLASSLLLKVLIFWYVFSHLLFALFCGMGLIRDRGIKRSFLVDVDMDWMCEMCWEEEKKWN